MADNIMDAFLLYVDENDDVRKELDARILSYQGDPENITRDVFVPFAREHGYNMTEADVDYYNSNINDGSNIPQELREKVKP